MTSTPKFKRIAAGDYETTNGRFRLVQLDCGATRAWNVEYGSDWISERIDADPENVTADDYADLIVDGAATKRDALALFAYWWADHMRDVRRALVDVATGTAATREP